MSSSIKVFENIGMTAKERRAIWHQLELTYMPWRNYDGHKFLEEGGFWMQKQHIFVNPFYYIDYALAQICAFQFFERSKKEPEKAWDDYYRLCQAGGSKGYFALLELAGLKNPFRGWNGGRSRCGTEALFKTKSKVYDPSGKRGRSEKGSRGGGAMLPGCRGGRL